MGNKTLFPIPKMTTSSKLAKVSYLSPNVKIIVDFSFEYVIAGLLDFKPYAEKKTICN